MAQKGATGATGPQGDAGLVTQVKLGTTTYTHSNGVISLPSYPTALPALGGNADTAKRLYTPRRINGIAFDGTADIQIQMDDTSVHVGTTAPSTTTPILWVDTSSTAIPGEFTTLKVTSTTASSSTTTGALTVAGGVGVAGNLYAAKVYGAVYNDYAERRKTAIEHEPGTVLIESESGVMITSSKRLQKCGKIVSDTYGFLIGETDCITSPIGVSGRVLAKTDNSKFKIGDCVCTGADGTVSKMNRLEIILFPDRIIGIVSELPTEEM